MKLVDRELAVGKKVGKGIRIADDSGAHGLGKSGGRIDYEDSGCSFSRGASIQSEAQSVITLGRERRSGDGLRNGIRKPAGHERGRREGLQLRGLSGGIGDGKMKRAGDRAIGFVEQKEIEEQGIAGFVDHSSWLHHGPEGR